MSRKRTRGASTQPEELPLFDLPLHGETDPPGTSPSAAATPAAEPGQSSLFESAEAQSALPATADRDPPETARTVSIGDRLRSGLADIGLIAAVVGLSIAFAAWLGADLSVASLTPLALFAVVFSFLYTIIPLAFWGHTPGMAWLGLSARGADGEPLTFSQTSSRWLGGLLTLATAGLPLLLALGGRSLSDRLSGSVTEREPYS